MDYLQKFKRLSLISEDVDINSEIADQKLNTDIVDNQEKRIDSYIEFEEYFRIWFGLLGVSKRPYGDSSQIIGDSEAVLNRLNVLTNSVRVLKNNLNKQSIIDSLSKIVTREQYIDVLSNMINDLDVSKIPNDVLINIIKKVIRDVVK